MSPASVPICSATAGADGSWSCNGHIPAAATAGAHGPHKIVAKGVTSLRKPFSIFTLM